MLGALQTTHAQTRPDAGQVLRDTATPEQPRPAEGSGVSPLPGADSAAPAPSPAPAGAGATTAATPAAPTFAIRSVRITGNTAFTEAELLPMVSALVGDNRSLADLQQAAARISRHYRQAGYLVARAYLPQQKLEDGALTIAVLEGKLTDIKVSNSSRLMSPQVEAFLARIPRNSPPQRDSVDRPVLLLGDVPGVGEVNARLSAGAEVGETVLNVSADPAPLAQARLEADNHGGLYTGRVRVGATVGLNSPFGYGERLSARLLASNGQLFSGRLGAQAPLGTDGLTASGGIGRTTYELGDVFEALQAQGRSDTLDLGLRYPLLRSSASNVYLALNGEQRDLRDEVRSTGTVTEKSARVFSLSLNGDWRDSLGGGGVTLASLTATSGQLDIDSAGAAEIDAVAAKTAGSYSKWGWSLERQQALARGVTFSAALRGQSAGKNLDSSEKFSLGGPAGVRAYASGEASGDEGWLASLELRYAISPGLSASVFHDRGSVTVNTRPYLETPNTLRRSGTGLGLQGGWGAFDWRLVFAWRGSQEGTAEPDKKMRVWFQAGWRF